MIRSMWGVPPLYKLVSNITKLHRSYSSVGQSVVLITPRSRVQAPLGTSFRMSFPHCKS